MSAAFSDTAPVAIAVSLSPLWIIAVSMFLLSPKPNWMGHHDQILVVSTERSGVTFRTTLAN